MFKKVTFFTIFVIFLLSISIIGFEITYRIVHRLNPNFFSRFRRETSTTLDYADVWRRNGLGLGGIFKRKF